MASAISRCAWAKRVSESMSNSTCLPWSRKYSAMLVGSLAAPDREQGIDGAHTDIERFADRTARERIDGAPGERHAVGGADRPLAIERPAGAIDDAPQQCFPDFRHAHVPGRNDARVRRQPADIAGWPPIDFFAGEPDHLGLHRISLRS